MTENKNMKLNDEAMVQASGGVGGFPEYDMIGLVEESLAGIPENKSMYRVNGSNDEKFDCEYDGPGVLAHGTEVYMIRNGSRWTIIPTDLDF